MVSVSVMQAPKAASRAKVNVWRACQVRADRRGAVGPTHV